MAYDDGFYYGQCKIICEAETTAYNGKTVTITAGSFSKSGVIANKLFECIVPGRGQYTISVLNGGTVLWSGTVEAGYGECIHQMLADGYEAIVEKKKLTLAEIEAAPGSVADYVPDADAVKTLNSNLVAENNQRFRYAYQNGKYGYIVKEADTDVFRPFSIMNNRVTLWENPNTSTSFSDQNVSLLSDFHDFELIEFRFLTKAGVSLDGDNVASVYYTPSDIDKFNSIATYKPTFMLSPSFYYTTAVNFRTLIKINNSTINIGNAHRYDGQYTRNDAVIPIGIYGIG